MKKVGIVICNYNKVQDVLDCIESVLASDFQDFDLYVVDNASTDGSSEAITRTYSENQVHLLQNAENLGGSGGFNTGIRTAYENGYPYVACLDNDILVDKQAIGALYEFMETHRDVGIVGSKVYHREEPEYIQQFGLNLDFERFGAKTLYADYLDDETVPEVVYCDAVATCSVLVRREAIAKAGIMPEDNFIYWDDMEWSHRISMAGYKIAAYAKSKVWHRMGAINAAKSSFVNYYLWRNQINFFMKYTPADKLETMSVYLLQSVFDAMYESMYREQHFSMNSIRYAFDDALHFVRGKAEDYKIAGPDYENRRLEELAGEIHTYYIEENDKPECAKRLERLISTWNEAAVRTKNEIEADVHFSLCDYVMYVRDIDMGKVYVDDTLNIIATEDDAMVVRHYDFSKSLFLYMNQNLFLDAAAKISCKE